MCTSWGGPYCGHYRALSYIENKKEIQKKERDKLNKFLKNIEKNKKIIDKLLRRTTMKKLNDSIYPEINYRINAIITIVTKKIEELSA